MKCDEKQYLLKNQQIGEWVEHTNEHGLQLRGKRLEGNAAVLEAVVGSADGVGRQNCENILPTPRSVGLENFDRAHALGNIDGAETEKGVMYAPSEFNRIIQTSFFEGPIKIASDQLAAEDKQMIMRVTLSEAIPDTARLGSISYECDVIPKDSDPWNRDPHCESYYLAAVTFDHFSPDHKLITDGDKIKMSVDTGAPEGTSQLGLNEFNKYMPDNCDIGEPFAKLRKCAEELNNTPENKVDSETTEVQNSPEKQENLNDPGEKNNKEAVDLDDVKARETSIDAADVSEELDDSGADVEARETSIDAADVSEELDDSGADVEVEATKISAELEDMGAQDDSIDAAKISAELEDSGAKPIDAADVGVELGESAPAVDSAPAPTMDSGPSM